MASWRLAKSLEVLRNEVNAMAPNRNKASDGTIGDAAHRDRPSRHNPNGANVVCAIDITHDPANGVDIHAIARDLVKHPHPNLEYVISNGEVAKRRNGFAWEPYTGSNKHNKHVHFAVGVGKDASPGEPYDDTTSWGVHGNGSAPATNAGGGGQASGGTLKKGAKGAEVKHVQERLNAHSKNDARLKVTADGDFGSATEKAVKAFQGDVGLTQDGVVGSQTLAKLNETPN
jgi:hypothetical protein